MPTNLPTIYMIPGLGTDYRIFSKLVPLLKHQQICYLEYDYEQAYEETIEAYAQRLAGQLTKETVPPILLGMSMGGTVATELAKLIPYQQLILISSYKHREEMPWIFKWARRLPIYRLVPAWFIRATLPVMARLLRVCTKEDAATLKAMLHARSAAHFAWGRNAIVHWDNEQRLERVVHIHGTRDHIFKLGRPYVTHVIEGGTHNMVMDRADEIALILNEVVFDRLTQEEGTS